MTPETRIAKAVAAVRIGTRAGGLFEQLEPRMLMAANFANASDNSIAYDGAGNLHLAYYDTNTQNVMYVRRATDGSWSQPVGIDHVGADAGGQISVAVGNGGGVGIAYSDAAEGDVKLARIVNGNVRLQTIDAHPGQNPVLQFNALGPVVSYYNPATAHDKIAQGGPTGWQDAPVPVTGASKRTSLAINPITQTAVVAFINPAGQIEIDRVVNGVVKTPKIVDGAVFPRTQVSLGFDAAGHATISYYDPAASMIRADVFGPTGWRSFQTAQVAPAGGACQPQLIIDRATGSAKVLYYAPNRTALWLASYNPANNTFTRSLLRAGVARGNQLTAPPTAGAGGPLAAPAVSGGSVTYSAIDQYPTGLSLSVNDTAHTVAPPNNIAVTGASAESVSLTWTVDAANEAGIRVRRSTDGQNFTVVATLPAGSTSFADAGLAPDTTYFYRVVAVAADGSNSVGLVAPAGVPAIPTVVTATTAHGAAVRGNVYVDKNNNGTLDAGDLAVSGVQIQLTGTDHLGNPVALSVVTDAQGHYAFNDLRAGTYAVTETQPFGYTEGIENASDHIDGISPSTQQAITDENFGEQLPSSAPQFLTPEIAAAAQKMQANTAQWQTFKAYLDAHLNVVISDGPEGVYEGSQLEWAAEFALGYQLLKGTDPATAAKYADKAVAIINIGLHSTVKGLWGGRTLVGRGDGTTTQFVLPDANVNTATLRVYTPSVYVKQVTRGSTPNGQDAADPYALPLKISRTSDGAADFTKGTDWRVNGDYSDGMIDWSLGSANQPAPGSTYYVTEATPSTSYPLAGDGSVYTVSGNTITFATAPSAGTAVFAEYLYGTPGQPDGGAYKESSDGRGGFNAIYYDNGYAARYIGDTAIAMDWLRGYDGFSNQLRSNAMSMLVRWSDYMRDHGYNKDSAASNYGVGEYFARTAIAIAAQGYTDQATADRLKNEVLDWRATHVLPTFAAPAPYAGTGTLNGGHWAEGWSYGEDSISNLMSAGMALQAVGWTDGQAERTWANECITSILSEEPTRSTIYDGGDVYTWPTLPPNSNTLGALSAAASNPTLAAYANYMAATSTAPGYGLLDLMFRDPAAPAIDPSTGNLPLQNLAAGTGFFTARKDWSFASTWLSFAVGNPVLADHQTFAQGQVSLDRGRDPLIILPDSAGEAQVTYKAAYGNTVIIDDNGAGTQTFPGNQAWTYGPQGCQMTASEGTAAYAYASGDYANAYGVYNSSPYVSSATKLTRSVFYVRDQDYAIVYDRVDTDQPNYEKQLQWWFGNAPQVSGNSWTAGAAHYSGDIYPDWNHNGVQDPNEATVNASWAVSITGTDMYGNAVNKWVATDRTGHFSFDDVVPGNYTFTTQYGDSVNVTDQSQSKLFGQTFSNVPIATTTSVQHVGHGDFDRLAVNPTAPTSSVRYITAMKVADASVQTADPTTHVTSADGKLDGTQIGPDVVMFGTNGTVTGGSSYAVTAAAGATLTHYITDLQPGVVYQLAGTNQATATASANGVITFTTTGTGTSQVVSIAPAS